ncbi:MAG TPA: peptidylprolyl isomerase [Usitatibacter sp.]|nr:peptidylprolyl isomerase [Usitatibacter sp.]
MNPSRIAIATLAAAACLPLAVLAQAPAAKGKCTVKDNAVKVRLTTSMGPIVLFLDHSRAPVSVDNFTKYVESGHYDGTIFHRVINGFMIQGGGFTGDMQQKPTQAPIKNEGANGLRNEAYTIAMARTNNPDSATAQFFINVNNNEALNAAMPQRPGYAVFGRVTEGKETVDKIKAVATGDKAGHQNVPKDPVVLQKAECI